MTGPNQVTLTPEPGGYISHTNPKIPQIENEVMKQPNSPHPFQIFPFQFIFFFILSSSFVISFSLLVNINYRV